MSRAVVQVWSAPQCQSGATPLGPLAVWQTARVTESEGSPSQLVFSGVPTAVVRESSLTDGVVLKVMSSTRGVSWWPVLTVTDSDGLGAGLSTITCGPLRTLLALRGLVRKGSTYRFTPAADQSPDRLVLEYVLDTDPDGTVRGTLGADGLDWITLGDVDVFLPLAAPVLTRKTRGEVLAWIESAAMARAVLRPFPDLDGSAGFKLDLLRDPAASRPVPHVTVGVQAARLDRVRDLPRSPSIVVPFDTDDHTMGVSAWTVSEIADGVWLTLGSGDAGPVGEADQWVGAYLRQANGTSHVILETRVRVVDPRSIDPLLAVLRYSDVRITSTAALSVNDVVGVTRTTSGLPVDEVYSPAGVTRRQRITGALSLPQPTLERNWLPGAVPILTDASHVPLGWSLVGGAAVVNYPRSTAPGAWSAQADGGYALGATVITIKNAPASSVLFGSEYLNLGVGGERVVSNGRVLFDGTGAGVVTLTTGLAAAILNNQAITGQHQLSVVQGRPKRPAAADYPALPSASPNALRFRSAGSSTAMPPPVGQDQVRSAAVRISYQTERPEYNRISAAAGFTVTNGQQLSGSNFGNLVGGVLTEDPSTADTRRLPALLLIGDPSGTPTRLAFGLMARSVAAGTVVSETVTLTHTITADTTVAVGIAPHTDLLRFAMCRWVSLWLGENDTPPALNGSAANAAILAANASLNGGEGGSRYRITGVDLAALLRTGEPLVLGQTIRVRSTAFGLDLTRRIIRLDWSLTDDALLDADLGGVQPRLTAVTVSL